METSSLINQAPLPRISPLPFAGPSPVVHPFPRPGNGHILPVEILSEIFQITAQGWDWDFKRTIVERQLNLMLVCRHWYAVMLSTPGFASTLRIRRATQKEVIQTFLQAKTSWLIDVIVDMSDITDGNDFNADNFHASFMAAAQAASRWRSLNLISLPSEAEFKSLQILRPLMELEFFELDQDFGMFFDLLMTAIGRTVTPHFTRMKLADPVSVPYIVRPAFLYISHSLVYLKIKLPEKMDRPVDVLPHLQRLQTFVAHHLCLPIYPSDAFLPLVETLKYLDLKSVSVQWMAGRIFPALQLCTIIFPHHAGAIQALQPVTMPSCWNLRYTSNDLSPLTHFHPSSLDIMDVRSGQWSVWRGDAHLLAVHHIFAANSQSLTRLHLNIRCSEQLLVCILSLLPKLEMLWLHLASPDALSEAFFQAFILGRPSPVGGSEVVRLPKTTIAPLCTLLWRLDLHYKRWLRGADKRSLLLAFGDIRDSRHEINFRLRLTFEKAPEQSWAIGALYRNRIWFRINPCGISRRYGMIAMSIRWSGSGPIPLPFREVEYLELQDQQDDHPIDFLYTLDHMELMKYDSNQKRLRTPLLRNLPLFQALRALVLNSTNPSFLAGHTFPKLERCKVKTRHQFGDIPGHGLFTEMPVCTRLVTDDLTLLSTFKLPLIQELAVEFMDPRDYTLWEKQIAVNTNLSGLKLLHMTCRDLHANLYQILRPLRSLETLIISFPEAGSFASVLPMWAPVISRRQRSSSEGRPPVMCCPMLQNLWIEGGDPSKMPKLIPFLRSIVTRRAAGGSPLRSFTFFPPPSESGSKFKLIGRDGGFTMENSVPAEGAKKFKLVI